jgi:hypothetical protein
LPAREIVIGKSYTIESVGTIQTSQRLERLIIISALHSPLMVLDLEQEPLLKQGYRLRHRSESLPMTAMP